MADISVTTTETVGVSDSISSMVPYWVYEAIRISEGTGVEVTLRLEHTPYMAEIPRTPTIQTMGCEEEGFE